MHHPTPLHGALMWRSVGPGTQHYPESNSLLSSPIVSHMSTGNEFNAICTALRCARRWKKLSPSGYREVLPDLSKHISGVERE